MCPCGLSPTAVVSIFVSSSTLARSAPLLLLVPPSLLPLVVLPRIAALSPPAGLPARSNVRASSLVIFSGALCLVLAGLVRRCVGLNRMGHPFRRPPRGRHFQLLAWIWSSSSFSSSILSHQWLPVLFSPPRCCSLVPLGDSEVNERVLSTSRPTVSSPACLPSLLLSPRSRFSSLIPVAAHCSCPKCSSSSCQGPSSSPKPPPRHDLLVPAFVL